MAKPHASAPRYQRERRNAELKLAREEKQNGRRLRALRGDGKEPEIPASRVPEVSGQRREEARLSRIYREAQDAFWAQYAQQRKAGRVRQREAAVDGLAPRSVRRQRDYLLRPLDSRKKRKARQTIIRARQRRGLPV